MTDDSAEKFVDTATADTVIPEALPAVGVVDVPPELPELRELPPADIKLAMDMQTLHAAINEITPIDGLAIDADEIIEIGYLGDVTPEQQSQIDAVIADWPLIQAKNEKLREIDAAWQANLASGWETPYGWKLGIAPQDVTLLMGAFILAKEASAMGLSDTGAIIDTDGVTHSMSLPELTQLMLMYGQARSSLSGLDAARREAVKNAISVEAAQVI
jgi:hypothetical protein